MPHRIRAAGIAIRDDTILLVKHVINGETFWVPPGGGLEPQDGSTIACVKREYFEETGLNVEVGRLIYVREFQESSRNRYHLELYYLADAVNGEITMENLVGLGEDEFYIKEVAWVDRRDLNHITVYPAELKADIWQKLANDDFLVEHLGVQVETF